jgi:hypothetical protein
LRCLECLYRGHAVEDMVCDRKQENLDILEEFATLGWITENGFRQDGAASGFYPVITLPQVKHVENMGGYSRLLNMTCIEAEDLADEGVRLHTKWVGAQPYYTAAIAKKAFQTATGAWNGRHTWATNIKWAGRQSNAE